MLEQLTRSTFKLGPIVFFKAPLQTIVDRTTGVIVAYVVPDSGIEVRHVLDCLNHAARMRDHKGRWT